MCDHHVMMVYRILAACAMVYRIEIQCEVLQKGWLVKVIKKHGFLICDKFHVLWILEISCTVNCTAEAHGTDHSDVWCALVA
jgi:hypothetical protein